MMSCGCSADEGMSSSTLADKVTFFLKDEVLLHNKKDDAWVIVNGKVIDITSLFCEPLTVRLCMHSFPLNLLLKNVKKKIQICT